MTTGGTNSAMRQALVAILKAQRQKMSKAARQRRSKSARWLYPWAQERHYSAAIRNWMRPMREYVQNFLATNSEAILRGDAANMPGADAVMRNDATAGKTFKLMVNSLNGWVGKYVPEKPAEAPYGEIYDSPVYIGLGNIADSTFDFNGKQYDKSAKHTLGIEFPTAEDWWKDARSTWIDTNYELIRSDLKKYIGQVNSLTEKAVTSGWSVGVLKNEIQTMDGKMKEGRANFIARDQIGKLNGQITQARMESAGLSMYEWSTSGDERVRESHALMDGGLCRWDDPAVYSDDGGKTWTPRPSGAVLLHPGIDYQCRCVALAYWDEIVDEVDAKIAEYEELDNTVAAGIAKDKASQNNNPLGWTDSFQKTLNEILDYVNKKANAADIEYVSGQHWGKAAQETRSWIINRYFQKLGSNPTPSALWGEMCKEINKAVKSSEISVRINLVDKNHPNKSIYKSLQKEFILKNQFETGTSGGSLSKSNRDNWEAVIANKNVSKMNIKDRPIYGAVDVLKNNSIASSQYGRSIIVLKDSVRSRTTFTLGNSSGQQGAFQTDANTIAHKRDRVTGYNNPFQAFRSIQENNQYLEAQVWGRAGIDDVAEIRFHHSDYDEITKTQKGKKWVDELRACGIKVNML